MFRLSNTLRLGASVLKNSAPVRHRSKLHSHALAKRASSPILDLFNIFDNDLLPTAAPVMPSVLHMDIKETDKDYEVTVDVPGVEKKDIQVSVRDDQLVICAERSEMKKEDRDNFRRVERFTGHVTRSLNLPHNVNTEAIEAQSENGVLRITIPKAEHTVDDSKIIDVK